MNRLVEDLVSERFQEEIDTNFQNWDPANLKLHTDTYKTLLIKGIVTDSNVSSLELGGLDFRNISNIIGQSSTLSGQFTDTVAYRGILYAWVEKAHHLFDNQLKRMKQLIPSTMDSYEGKVNFLKNLTKPRNTMALNDLSLIKFNFDEERAEAEDREISRPGSAFLCEADLDAPPPPKSKEKEMNSPIVNDGQPRSNIANQRNDEGSIKSSDTQNILKNKQTQENTDEPSINKNDANHSNPSKNVQRNVMEHEQITKESDSVPQADRAVKEVTVDISNIPAGNDDYSQEISSVITDEPRNPFAESTKQSTHNRPASNTPKTLPKHAHNTEINSVVTAEPASKPPQESISAQPLINTEQGDQLFVEEIVNGPADEPVMDEPKTIESNNDLVDAQNLPKQTIPADAFNFIGTGAPPPSPVKSNPIQAHIENANHAPTEEYENNDVDLGGNEMELLEEEVPSSVGSLLEYPSRDDNLRAERANRISPPSSEGSQITRSPQKRKRESPPPPQNNNEREYEDIQKNLGSPANKQDELCYNQSESTILDTSTNGSKRKAKNSHYFRRQGVPDPELPAPKRVYRERAPRRSNAPPHHPVRDDQPRNEMMQEMEQEADLPSFDMDLRNADPRDSLENSLDSSPLGHDLNEPNNDSFGIPLDDYDYPVYDQEPEAPTTGDSPGQDLAHGIIYSEQFSKEVETYLGSFDPEGVSIQELVQRIADKENESSIHIYMLLMNDMGINYAPRDLSVSDGPIKIATTKVAIQDTSVDEEDNNSLNLIKACLNNLHKAQSNTELADHCDPQKADSQQRDSKQEKSEQEESEQKKSSREEPFQEEAQIVPQNVETQRPSPLENNSTQAQAGHIRTVNVPAGDEGSQNISDKC